MIFTLSFISFGSFGNNDSLEAKLKELETLHSDMKKNFDVLHKEMKKYLMYGIDWGFLRGGTKYYSRYEIAINGYDKTDEFVLTLSNNFTQEGHEVLPSKGLLPDAQKKLSLLRIRGQSFDELMRDNTQKTQLILCYKYNHKEKQLYKILMNIHNAMEVINSEIDFIKTDIKLNNMKDSQLIDRIDVLLKTYQRSNYEFHDVDANPNNEILRSFWKNL